MGIGDVLVSSTIHNHDRRMLLPIFVDYGVHNHAAVATPKLREVRGCSCSLWQGAARLCTMLTSFLLFSFWWLVQALGYKLGVVSTGNSLDHVEADDAQMAANGACRVCVQGTSHGRLPHPVSRWRRPSKSTDASVKDMEAAAVAWAAELYHVPYLALKVVTDIGA